jgi:glycosyltransferase involved in cell wall biosynthesis
MIRVGFATSLDFTWLGGVNYIKNLLIALSTISEKEIQPVVFLSTETHPSIIDGLRPYSEIIFPPFLRKDSPCSFIWRLTKKLFDSDFFLEIFLKRYFIDVMSHSNIYGMRRIKSINWIPDFQHYRLKEMFSRNEIFLRNRLYRSIAKKSDFVVLSSVDALNDYCKLYPLYSYKGRVLSFVPQIDKKVLYQNKELDRQVLNKYDISDIFFFLPNQFWKHKNHLVVFQAMASLKAEGLNILLVCTGEMSDYRDPNHFDSLLDYINANNLNVRLLGVIPYNDVISLMRSSVAVVNPSKFEGWSSTVEECKIVGKKMILSDIQVHREQNHHHCSYFPFNDVSCLAGLMRKNLEDLRLNAEQSEPVESIELCQRERTKIFADQYRKIVFDSVSLSQNYE